MSTATDNGAPPRPAWTTFEHLDDRLQALVSPLRQELEQAEALKKDLARSHREQQKALVDHQQQEMSAVEATIAKLHGVLKPLDGDKREVRRRRSSTPTTMIGVPRTNGTATGFGVTIEQVGEFVKWIEQQFANGAEFVFQKDAYVALGADQSKGSGTFRYLRHIGYLRKAGRAPGSTRERWGILDAQAFEQACSEASKHEGNLLPGTQAAMLLDWLRQDDQGVVTKEKVAENIDLSPKRALDNLAELTRRGYVERVKLGHYRLRAES